MSMKHFSSSLLCFHRYLTETYEQYYYLLDGSATLEVDNFLKSGEHELTFFAKVAKFLPKKI